MHRTRGKYIFNVDDILSERLMETWTDIDLKQDDSLLAIEDTMKRKLKPVPMVATYML